MYTFFEWFFRDWHGAWFLFGFSVGIAIVTIAYYVIRIKLEDRKARKLRAELRRSDAEWRGGWQ